MRQELITELNAFVAQKKYEELKQYIMESDSDERWNIMLELECMTAQNDDLFQFLYEINNANDSKEFDRDEESFFANILIYSCNKADDIKWFIKKMKEHNLTPTQVITAGKEIFGCGEIGENDILYLEMLSEIY